MDKELEEIANWKRLRPLLNNTYDFNVNRENWTKAIKLFQTRLDRKFFKPIKSIIDKKILEGAGFTIVTVQCAIIESLASFRTGQIFSHKKQKVNQVIFTMKVVKCLSLFCIVLKYLRTISTK